MRRFDTDDAEGYCIRILLHASANKNHTYLCTLQSCSRNPNMESPYLTASGRMKTNIELCDINIDRGTG
jgi:hypothetical protein